jgi:hypothetical protein
VDTAREIERADATLGVRLGGQLEVIADEIRALHRARCSFQRRPGATYHLYRDRAGALAWSMLSPAEWGSAAPHDFEGSYRLELDMSWTLLDEPPPR